MNRITVAAALGLAFFCGVSPAQETTAVPATMNRPASEVISTAETLFIQGHQAQVNAIQTLVNRFNNARTGDTDKAELANCLAWMEFKQEHSDLASAATHSQIALRLNPSDKSFLRDAEVFKNLLRAIRSEIQPDPPKSLDSPLVDVTTPENARACSRSRNEFIDAVLRERANKWDEWRILWQDALALNGGTAAFEMLTKHTTTDPSAVMASALPRLRAGDFKEAHDRLRKLAPKNVDGFTSAPNADALYVEVLIDIATDEPVAATTEFEELEAIDRARSLVLESAGMENFTHPARPPSIDVKISFLLMVMQTEQLFASEIYNGVFERAAGADQHRFSLAAERLQNFDIAHVRDDFRTQLAALDRRTADHFYAFELKSKARDEEIQTTIAALTQEAKRDYDETRAQMRSLFRGLDVQKHALDRMAFDITAIRARQNDADVAQRFATREVAQRLDDLAQQIATDRQRTPKDWEAIKDKVDRLVNWQNDNNHTETVTLIVEVTSHVLAELDQRSAVKFMMRVAPLLLLLE